MYAGRLYVRSFVRSFVRASVRPSDNEMYERTDGPKSANFCAHMHVDKVEQMLPKDYVACRLSISIVKVDLDLI